VRGASEGKGLGNAFLSHISAVDGMYHVVIELLMMNQLFMTKVMLIQ